MIITIFFNCILDLINAALVASRDIFFYILLAQNFEQAKWYI